MSKTWYFVAGAAVAGILYWKNRDDVQVKVRKTARRIRRELDPMQERVSDRLDDLASTIVSVNRKLRTATRVVDAALGKIA